MWHLLLSIAIGLTGSKSMAASLNPSSAAKVIVVSDIDDTLKISHVAKKSWDTIGDVLGSQAFAGVTPLFTSLVKNDLEIQFISGAPTALGGRLLARDFLEDNQLQGELSTRNNIFESIYDSKTRTIRRLMAINPQADFVFLGDNGESDVEVYGDLLHDPILGHRVKAIYIHKVYDGDPAKVIPPDENAFVTMAEVAISMEQNGWLEKAQAQAVLNAVIAAAKNPDLSSSVLPTFAEITQCDIDRSIAYLSAAPADEMQMLFVAQEALSGQILACTPSSM